MYRHHRQLQQTVRVTMVHEHGRSKQIALFHGRKLPRLAPPLMVVLICAALAVVLFLLFPENAYQRFAMSAKTDAATLEYLRQLHRAQPTNDELSMALAEHLYNAGQYNEAQTVAGTVSGELKAQAHWLSVRAAFAHYNSYGANDARKEPAKERLLVALQAMDVMTLARLAVEHVEALATLYLQLEQPVQAAQTYELLAEFDSQRQGHWLAESAKWFVAGNKFQEAVRINERLLAQAATPEQRHALLLERARYYEWSAQPLKAAAIYGQLHEEGVTSPLVDQKIMAYPSFFAGTNALRDSLLRENARRALSADEVHLLVDILEHHNKQPRQAARVLATWLDQHGAHQPLSLRLTYLYWALGEPKKALAVMKTYRQHFESDVDATLLYAQLEHESGSNAEAIAALLAVPHQHLTRIDYWTLLGELAWQQEEMAVAEMSYERLYRLQASAFYGERFFWASLANGKLDQAVTLLLTNSDLKHPALISQILSVSQAAGHEDVTATLFAFAEKNLADFYEVNAFWPLYARYVMHHQGEEKAEEVLLSALKRAPRSVSLHYGLLWFYLETQNKKKLPIVMRLAFQQAVENEEFWPVYAAAYVLLDQPRKALAWFNKYQQQHSEDLEWLLYFADILAVARYTDFADEVRQRVLQKNREAEEDVATQTSSYGLALHSAQAQYQTADGQWAVVKQRLAEKPLAAMSADEITFVFERFQQYSHPRSLVWGSPHARQALKMAPYQRLYLALESNNLTDIEQLLAADRQQKKQHLAASDTMVGLERLGMYQQSLNVALNALQHNTYVNENVYQRHAALMQQKYPRQVGLRAFQRQSSNLEELTEISRLLWSHNNRWTGEIEQRYSRFEDVNDARHVDDETMLTGELQYRDLRRSARVKMGYNYSPDLTNFFTAEAEAKYWLTQRLQGALQWQWQHQSYESEVFRLHGLKNTGKAQVNYSLTPRSQVSFSVAHAEFKTRHKGLYLGKGQQAEVHYNYALLKGFSYALVPHVSAVKIRNSLSMPYGPVFLPKEYESVNAGIRVSRGNVDGLYSQAGGLRFSIDAGVSYSEPSNSAGLNLEASVATSVFGSDEFSIYADRSVIRNEAGDYLRSIGARYEYFLGK